ncbi:unnamed protein product [Gemmataceae bacterium]|nr:unnamed protein product [Gemmataceae bacterium]VTU01473.1 unnamed protein product [Gemmataceae bacterium]
MWPPRHSHVHRLSHSFTRNPRGIRRHGGRLPRDEVRARLPEPVSHPPPIGRRAEPVGGARDGAAKPWRIVAALGRQPRKAARQVGGCRTFDSGGLSHLNPRLLTCSRSAAAARTACAAGFCASVRGVVEVNGASAARAERPGAAVSGLPGCDRNRLRAKGRLARRRFANAELRGRVLRDLSGEAFQLVCVSIDFNEDQLHTRDVHNPIDRTHNQLAVLLLPEEEAPPVRFVHLIGHDAVGRRGEVGDVERCVQIWPHTVGEQSVEAAEPRPVAAGESGPARDR